MNTLPSKTVAIPYTYGLSRLFSGAVAGEHSSNSLIHLGFISVNHYEELERQEKKIYPSTTRGGKELPSGSALDSPSVLSKLATPTPAIDSDMSHVIDDATSAMYDAYDKTTSLFDNTVPLDEFLDEHLAKVRTIDYAEDDDIFETDEIIETENFETPVRPSSPRYELHVIPGGLCYGWRGS